MGRQLQPLPHVKKSTAVNIVPGVLFFAFANTADCIQVRQGAIYSAPRLFGDKSFGY